MICQAGKPQEEEPSQQNSVWQISSQILSSSTQQKRAAHFWTDSSVDHKHWPEKHWKEPKVCTICHGYNRSWLHSELFWGELHWLHLKTKHFHIDHTALIYEKGPEEVKIPEQSKCTCLVRKLQDLAHTWWTKLCRPTISDFPHLVHLHLQLMVPQLPCLVSRSSPNHSSPILCNDCDDYRGNLGAVLGQQDKYVFITHYLDVQLTYLSLFVLKIKMNSYSHRTIEYQNTFQYKI